MKRADVSPLPWRAPGRLVVDGPFRFSRNPLYVSLTLMYLGISVAANALWPLAFLIFAVVIVDRGVILQEERFLEKRFGEEYRSYKARVRRWV
jgi:protein-S-isoprenylcysteine O-methyltransferase Ste14